MKFKRISRQELSDASARIINKPPTTINYSFYELAEWNSIKDTYITENPLCELCLNEGNENKADHVHHIKPLIQGGAPF